MAKVEEKNEETLAFNMETYEESDVAEELVRGKKSRKKKAASTLGSVDPSQTGSPS